jgi:copper chaperone CopZ
MKLFRRHFLQSLTTAGTIALTDAAPAHEGHTVTWRVTGFTCITCAVGLETVLSQRIGVLEVKASYPDGIVHIRFNSAKVSERDLRESISEMGFRVESHT